GISVKPASVPRARNPAMSPSPIIDVSISSTGLASSSVCAVLIPPWGRKVSLPGPSTFSGENGDVNVCPVIVGRDAEMYALIASLAEGGLVLVAGEAGIGKSRLLREFAVRADELSVAVLAHLARSAQDDGVLIVGTYRTEEANVDPLGRLLDIVTRDRIATELTLQPLGEDATAQMVEAMWDARPTASELSAI